MQNFNYHGHTYRCGHAEKNMTDEDWVKKFIEKGFKKIAFTDHCPEKEVIDKRQNMRMNYSQKQEYLNSIKQLKEKYKNQIEIESGFEVEFLPGQEENLLELKNETDKIILGQHFVYDDDKKLRCFRRVEYTDADLLRYAEYIELALKNKIPDIIAHPDLYMINRKKFGDIESKVAHLICKAAEKYDIPIEINLSEPVEYLKDNNYKISYPCKDFWKIATKYNVKVIYGIDLHWNRQIELYEEAVKLVNNMFEKEIIDKLNFCNKNLEVNR